VQIEYDIQKPGLVKARVYDLQGKSVRSLISETMPAGRYKLIWNGENDHSENVSTGIYYCTMQTEDLTGTIKLVLIR
jgi:flagellar hook assembly protein FlgD